MVDLVLNDLGAPASECFDAGLELLVLPLNLDGLVAFAGTRAAQQRKAAFLRIIRA